MTQNIRERLFKLSIILALIGVLFLVISYFCFHYLTDGGFTTVWQPEAGKPYVTLYVGIFGVIMLAEGAVGSLCALLLFENEGTNK